MYKSDTTHCQTVAMLSAEYFFLLILVGNSASGNLPLCVVSGSVSTIHTFSHTALVGTFKLQLHKQEGVT